MKLGKNHCVNDSAASEQAFTSASHESPDNIVSEKDASRAGVYGFAPALRVVDGCSVLVGGACLRFCIIGVALYSAPCFVVS